jgi:hypothetical protein
MKAAPSLTVTAVTAPAAAPPQPLSAPLSYRTAFALRGLLIGLALLALAFTAALLFTAAVFNYSVGALL